MSKNGLDVDEDMLPVNLRNDLDDVNNQSEILQAEIEFNDSEIERTREKLNATYVDSNLDVVADRAVETVGTCPPAGSQFSGRFSRAGFCVLCCGGVWCFR